MLLPARENLGSTPETKAQEVLRRTTTLELQSASESEITLSEAPATALEVRSRQAESSGARGTPRRERGSRTLSGRGRPSGGRQSPAVETRRPRIREDVESNFIVSKWQRTDFKKNDILDSVQAEEYLVAKIAEEYPHAEISGCYRNRSEVLVFFN